MVVKAFLRANIPFVFDRTETSDEKFISRALKSNWEKFDMQGNFLLKHINLSFANNVTCLLKNCNKTIQVPITNFKDNTTTTHDITISQVQIYCFDTGIGFCTLHIPYDTETEEKTITDVGSVLYNSATGAKTIVIDNGKETFLNCIADEMIKELFTSPYKLYGTINDNSNKRNNIFSCVLFDSNNTEETNQNLLNQYCYQLANTYDNRSDTFSFCEQDLCHQHDYIRWGFSTRGVAAIANLTGKSETDNFLLNAWFKSVSTNYFYLYLMVLHEKFATYHYLNIITDDSDASDFEINQKLLIDFNFKYIFKIVSDEQFIQNTFLKFKVWTNADDAYLELTEQLKKMFDNAEYNANKSIEKRNQKFNFISILISIVCAVSIVFETLNLFFSRGLSLGFNTIHSTIFTGIIILEILFIISSIFYILFDKK